jgi:ribonuclease R
MSGLADRVRFVARVESTTDGPMAVGAFGDGSFRMVDEFPEPGSWISAQRHEEGVQVVAVLARPGTARASLYGILADHALDPEHERPVLDEVEAWQHAPGIADADLEDARALPFVTVDGPGTRDLDQALHVARADEGWVVRYALADAAFFVRPGSALFREALRRGASYYLPGVVAPMLPRPLSEGLVSLNPAVDRRAMVFEMRVDPDGVCTGTRIVRARIHSRARLDFDSVQSLLDGRAGGPTEAGVRESLHAFAEVGRARLARAISRGAVPHRSEEIKIAPRDEEGLEFVVFAEPRTEVERYNEQLSLLCNVEGAKFLLEHGRGAVQPIFRTHAAPPSDRIDELAALIDAVVRTHELDDRWRWHRDRQSLAEYLQSLPTGGRHDRVVRALSRQAIMVNVRSSFSAEPGPHFGIGADAYARFSAPMREIVGVYVHKEAWEQLHGAGPPDDDELRARVIEQANRARELQSVLTREANLVVIDRVFARDAALPWSQRPDRIGTVMGLRGDKIYVQLDDPPIDVKVYLPRVDPDAELDARGVRVKGGHIDCRLGDEVAVRVRERDPRDGRWLLDLVPHPSP